MQEGMASARYYNLCITTLSVFVLLAGVLPFLLNLPTPSILEKGNEKLVAEYDMNELYIDETPSLRHVQNRTILFVHVGKAGGSTLQRSFYKQYWQPGNILQRTPVLLPICHMHACHNKTLYKATTLLFVVRNPVDRMISSYKFSHPDNCVTYNKDMGMNVENDIWGCHMPKAAKDFYRQCAPTLEELANAPFDKGTTTMCHQSILGMVRGGNDKYRKQSTHAFFNYAHYKNVTIQSLHNDDMTNSQMKEIFVVRTSHLWEDASHLDSLMNGTGYFTGQKNVTHGSENYHKHTSTLSNQGYEHLCCMLSDEINIFEEIVFMAENLSKKEKNDTIRDVERKCGIPLHTSRVAWAKACKEKLDVADLE